MSEPEGGPRATPPCDHCGWTPCWCDEAAGPSSAAPRAGAAPDDPKPVELDAGNDTDHRRKLVASACSWLCFLSALAGLYAQALAPEKPLARMLFASTVFWLIAHCVAMLAPPRRSR